jgi:hypothetical protein
MMKQGYIFLLSLFLYSCLGEEDEAKGIVPPVDRKEPEKEIALTLRLPGMNVPVVYSEDIMNENDIETLDVLVFKIEKDGEHFYQHIPVSSGIMNNGSIKHLSVKLQSVSVPVRLLVLANVNYLFTPQIIDGLKTDSLAGNVEKGWILNRFVFDFNEPWSFDKSSNPEAKALPMYGESGIINPSAPEASEINMQRSVVRLDIGTACPTLNIDSVYLYYTENKGFVAPWFDDKGVIIETPHVPANSVVNKKSFRYKFAPVTNAAGVQIMEKKIYFTEDMQDMPTATTLIVKARNNDGPYQYYRVNMIDKAGMLVPFLRNNRYKVIILDVNGSGYASAQEAADAPSGLESILDAHVLDIREYVTNDQYLLGVSTSHISFTRDGSWDEALPGDKAFRLIMRTTYSRWSAQWIDNVPDWVEMTDDNGNTVSGSDVHPSTATSLYFRILHPNKSGAIRTAKLKLVAGILVKEITITQDI